MSLTLTELEIQLKKVNSRTFHYEASKAEFPYTVYAEYRKRSKHADNTSYASFWRVQIDCYTKVHNDPVPDDIEFMLKVNKIPHTLSRVFDYELKAIRHIFDCDGIQDG